MHRPESKASNATGSDDLDRFYREIWGEHIHHGLWRSNSETAQAAPHRLIAEVLKQACVRPNDRVCDVGCGYVGTSRILAREYGVTVTALTVSQAQFDHAVQLDPGSTNPNYMLRDWLSNCLAPESFDVVIAIESSEHMANLETFFTEVARVLKPGGRFVVCAWLSKETPSHWERRVLSRSAKKADCEAWGQPTNTTDSQRPSVWYPPVFRT
jgi:tocopherol O-methyltransferase